MIICYYKLLSLRFSFKALYPVAYNSIMLCVRPVLVAYTTQHLTWIPDLTWRPDLRTDLCSNYFATPFSRWVTRNNRLPLITDAPTENASHVMMATGLEKFGTLYQYLLHKLIHIMRLLELDTSGAKTKISTTNIIFATNQISWRKWVVYPGGSNLTATWQWLTMLERLRFKLCYCQRVCV